MVFLALFILSGHFRLAVMDLCFCPLKFLWFYSQFAVLLQMHFGPLVLSQDLSLSDWLTCHSISCYIWHENIININSFTKIDTGEKIIFAIVS